MKETFDLCVVGAGPGGVEAAMRAAARGLRTVLVEACSAGGVCLGAGCIPLKTLLASAGHFAGLRRSAMFGVRIPEGACVDWPAMQARKEDVVRRLRAGLEGRLDGCGVTRVRGRGVLVSPTRVRVEAEGTEPVELEARSILLATGSSPAFPPNVGPGRRVVDASAAMDVAELPRRVVVAGGGAAGCELATLFSELGVATTLVEASRRLLSGLDADLGRFAAKVLSRDVRIVLGKGIDSAEERADGVRVQCGGQCLEADLLVVATGRRPNSDGLGLEALGIRPDGRGAVPVDAAFRTSVPSVLAVGDLAGKRFLAHAAAAEAAAAVDGLTGRAAEVRADLVPSCVFTNPEIASVGLSEEDCRTRGVACRVFRTFARATGFCWAAGETEGFAKIVADRETDRILGVHVAGQRSAELMGEAALAISCKLSAEAFLRMVRPHPTFSEVLSAAVPSL